MLPLVEGSRTPFEMFSKRSLSEFGTGVLQCAGGHRSPFNKQNKNHQGRFVSITSDVNHATNLPRLLHFDRWFIGYPGRPSYAWYKSKLLKYKHLKMSSMMKFTEVGKKIVAVGRNYKEHAAELGNKMPDKPLIFLKPTSSYLCSGNILIPPGCSQLHHEVELGVVIAAKCRQVSESTAMQHVAGYALALDMTARDFQNEAKAKGHPWTMAKCFDTACPVSTFVARERIADPASLRLWCAVNGEVRQSGTTADMHFTVPFLLSYISRFMTLEPGDLVLTGTPGGVGPVFPGDVIEASLLDHSGQIAHIKVGVEHS